MLEIITVFDKPTEHGDTYNAKLTLGGDTIEFLGSQACAAARKLIADHKMINAVQLFGGDDSIVLADSPQGVDGDDEYETEEDYFGELEVIVVAAGVYFRCSSGESDVVTWAQLEAAGVMVAA